MMWTTIGDLFVSYDDSGHGDGLVLIHGHPFDKSMWRPQVEAFSSAGWRVVAPDLRGYGLSTAIPGTSTMGVFARDIATVLDRLGLDRVVLAGLSMGGQIVLEFAHLFQHRLRAIVLADTSARAETAEGRRHRHELADRLVDEGMDGYADEVLPRMITAANIEALPEVAAQVRTMMRGTPAEGAAAALRGRAERRDYVPLLSEIAVPALVVVGRHDDFTPIAEAELLADRIPDATLTVIDGAGHLPNLERPRQFNTALQAFLNRLTEGTT